MWGAPEGGEPGSARIASFPLAVEVVAKSSRAGRAEQGLHPPDLVLVRAGVIHAFSFLICMGWGAAWITAVRGVEDHLLL